MPDFPNEPNEKLQGIINICQVYPQNKEVTRYHAAFVVQLRLSKELEEYISLHTLSKKDQLLSNLEFKQD